MPRSPWHRLLPVGALPRRIGHRPQVEPLAPRALPTGGLASVLPLDPNGAVSGDVGVPGEVSLFRLTVPESGRLTARVHARLLPTRLSLLGPDGQVLVQSDGQSAADP